MFKKKEQYEHEADRPHVSRDEKGKRRLIILAAGILVIITVLALVGTAFYQEQYKPMHETVIKVNDATFSMLYYVNMLKLLAAGSSPEYLPTVADNVVQTIEQMELIRQGAATLNITITNTEVDKKLESFDPPLSKDYRDLVRAQMLMTKIRDEYFDSKVPQTGEQRQIMAMFLESQSVAEQIRARLEKGESFSSLAADYSPDQVIKDNKGDLSWRPKGVLPLLMGSDVLEEQVFKADVGVLSQPVADEAMLKTLGYWIVKVIERRQEGDQKQAHIRAILLGSEEEAKQVKARIEAGEDFATLAEQLSQDASTKGIGGDFGFISEESSYPVFKSFLFGAEQKTLSDPVRDEAVITKGGYWLFEVIAKEDDRTIQGENRDILKTDLTNKWFSSLKDSSKIENLLDDVKKQWAIARVTKEL